MNQAIDRPPVEQEVCRALEDNLWSLWSRFGRGDGCVLHDDIPGL